LVVLRHGVDGKQWRVECQCDCGKRTNAQTYNLLKGRHHSCGCLQREQQSKRRTQHGASWGGDNHLGTPEYRAWRHMRERCLNSKNASYPDYGGRGITISPAWDRFEQFLADVGQRPSPNHSLDRIENDGPYAPGNCRWATPSEQAANKRRRRWYRRPAVEQQSPDHA
jgi:hypothetical protein